MTAPHTPSGKLYTSNLPGLKKLKTQAARLLITRAGAEISNVEPVRALSPSPELFYTYLDEWRDRPDKSWWPEYERRFGRELESQEKLTALRDVYKRLLKGQDVVLICFCKDHRYCHRRLVGEFFSEYGVQAEELNPVTVEQIDLF
ncbi:DUF488 domain-containing protein [Saccharibacillus kuerlensis]|uniref:DUF488 domain-containing protein n=1 Tax=Saccharibacillus kuerlensis TaxID=459527 RepID=A0ABQ2LBJ0_9BACL|nr:DUF488 domain-containing protein [Saccharibacillus kuerlensis]GGO09443.1 hypothetical protein GCM10010969_39870 [Saccharibacillus kuerlensis]